VLGVAVYLRWFRVLLEQEAVPVGTQPAHPSHQVALVAGTLGLVVLSVQPQLLLGLFG